MAPSLDNMPSLRESVGKQDYRPEPLSVDQLVAIADQTVLAPRGAWGMALAMFIWYSLRPDVVVLGFVAWAVAVSIGRLAIAKNRYLVSRDAGRFSPPVPGDVAVVTGAAHGLGLLVAATLVSRGINVVTVDTHDMPIKLGGECRHYKLDIRSEEQVNELARKVETELGKPPVAVVGCAGIARGGSLTDISSSALQSVVEINFLGQLYTVRAFLPAMLAARRGMVVAVSSSTAIAAPANASVYAASKAALRTAFTALRHELKGTGVRSLLVTPGQLDTRMFASVKSPSTFWAPVVSAADLAAEICDGIAKGRAGELRTPVYSKLLPWVMLLPQSILDALRAWNGLDTAMDSYSDADI